MQKIWIAAALTVLAVAGAGAGAGATSARPNALTGNVWLLTAVLGKAPVAGTSPTSEFTSASVSGSGGCNRYSGKVSASGTTIRISAIASTEMACQPKIMAQESVFLNALASARSYSTSGGTLTLKGSNGRALLTYKAQSQQLAGTSWSVLSYNNGKQGVVSVNAATKLTAAFAKDGNLTGFAGCNNYAGTFKGTSPKISISQLSSTRKYCATPTGVMDQESQYLAALLMAATYRIEGRTLELRTKSGAIAAEFQAK